LAQQPENQPLVSTQFDLNSEETIDEYRIYCSISTNKLRSFTKKGELTKREGNELGEIAPKDRLTQESVAFISAVSESHESGHYRKLFNRRIIISFHQSFNSCAAIAVGRRKAQTDCKRAVACFGANQLAWRVASFAGVPSKTLVQPIQELICTVP
jgi:hypothetical protein